MIKTKDNIVKKDLVLVGAGHSHIEVIKYLGKLKLNGLRITLISKNPYCTYSGMVPGYIEGQYNWSEINIDVVRLAFKNNIRLILNEVVKISGKDRVVYLKNNSIVEYDILSINIGIESNKNNIEGAEDFAYALKPISEIDNIISSITLSKQNKVAIIGAGAAGVEVALALNERFQKLGITKKIILIANSNTIMKSYPVAVAKKLEKAIFKKNITILFKSTVTKVLKSSIVINNIKKIKDCCSVLATNGVAPYLVKTSDLALSKNGFISVKKTLQTSNFKNIFASGDVVDIEDLSLVKAGIYAVRQANILKKNLKKIFYKKKLINFYPQKSYLSIIGTTDNSAILHKYCITVKGKIFWFIKKYIDKKFIEKYSYNYKKNKIQTFSIESKEPSEHKMQCEGCGSKIPFEVLKQVFSKNINLGSLDANNVECNSSLVHTVDAITSIIDDLYLMGRIAAKHSLNDLFAGRAYPISTQMIISTPKSLNIIQKRDIYQISEGANSIFTEVSCSISGGHSYSSENEKSSIGFSLIGKIKTNKNKPLNSKKKHKIYMTGKIGTALVMAALKQSLIEGEYYKELVDEMTKSNIKIFKIIQKYNILDITDISGFGLALHLKNLLIRNKKYKGANIFLNKILMLNGAKKAMQKNVISSLTYSNKSSVINSLEIISNLKRYYNILYDPQTAGGFLFITQNNKIIKEFLKNNVLVTEIGEISDEHSKIRVL